MKEPFFVRWAKKKNICGICVACFLSRMGYAELTFRKVEQALRLIEEVDPRRSAQIQRDVAYIWVGPLESDGLALWIEHWRLIKISITYLEAEDTSVELIALCLVHEAQHARLMRLGFDYEEEQRVQVERICLKAERAFARRLPDNAALIAGADERISYYVNGDGAGYFSDTGRTEANIEYVRQSAAPRWIRNMVIRRMRNLEAKRLKTLEDKEKSGNIKG